MSVEVIANHTRLAATSKGSLHAALTIPNVHFSDNTSVGSHAGNQPVHHPTGNDSTHVLQSEIHKNFLIELRDELLQYIPTFGAVLFGIAFFEGGHKKRLAQNLAEFIDHSLAEEVASQSLYQTIHSVRAALVNFLKGEIRHNKYQRRYYNNNDIVSNSRLLNIATKFFSPAVTKIESEVRYEYDAQIARQNRRRR